uniref:Uncharacterized protein n=1 Tax=Acrobeloides nanus TaxID=290746 RepID=A0A914CPA1_9BILA
MRRFLGKSVVLTDISSDICQNVCSRFANEDANLALHGKNYDDLRETFGLLLSEGITKDRITLINTDINLASGRKRLFEEILRKFGRIDVLVTSTNDSKGLNELLSLAIPHLAITNGKFMCIGNRSTSGVDPELLSQCERQGIRFYYINTLTANTKPTELSKLILFLTSNDPDKFYLGSHAMLISVLLSIFLTAAFIPPFSQPQSYHDYAVRRIWYGIPYADYVLSNIGFLLTGGYGVIRLLLSSADFKKTFVNPWEFAMYTYFFATIFATAFGSAYYHWNPNNSTLFWDRLPISMAMMSLFSAVITERVSTKLGIVTFPVLQFLGALATVHWMLTENAGVGDLKLYGLVQIMSTFCFPLILLAYPSRFSGTHNLFYAVACFLLARGAELSDKLVYKWTLQTVGGHVLKHIFASISVFFIYRYAKKRVPMERPIYYLYEIKPIRKVIDFSRRIYQIFKRD